MIGLYIHILKKKSYIEEVSACNNKVTGCNFKVSAYNVEILACNVKVSAHTEEV